MIFDSAGEPVALPEHFPLQQGLKPVIFDSAGEPIAQLPEHFPLQQGLKLAPYLGVGTLLTGFLSTFHYNKD